MRRLIPILLILCVASPVWGQGLIQNCPQGVLHVGLGTATFTSGMVRPTNTASLIMQFVRDAGTATAEMQVCCTNNCPPNAAGDWATVANSSGALDGTTTTRAPSVLYPTCLYRGFLSAADGSADIDVFYRCGPDAR